MSHKLTICAAFVSLALPCCGLAQPASDLAQKRESLFELQTDQAILEARLKNNRAEYTIPAVCGSNVRLPEPLLTARKNYCNQKATEFNTRDADLKAQWQKLSERIRHLDLQIREPGTRNPK